jgi:hypothetical protein
MKTVKNVVAQPITKFVFCFIAGVTVAIVIFGFILQLG